MAEAVCAEAGRAPVDVDDALASLVEQSMVAVVSGEHRRYRLLETIRAFALDRLAERGALVDARSRLRAVYAEEAAAIGAGLASPESVRWAVTWDEEMPNLRAVHDDAVATGDLATAFALVEHLPVYLRGDDEAVRWPQATLAVRGAEHHPLATVAALWLIAALVQQARTAEALARIDRLVGHGLTERAANSLRALLRTVLGDRGVHPDLDPWYRDLVFGAGFVSTFSTVTTQLLAGREEVDGCERLRNAANESGSPFHRMCVRSLDFVGTAHLDADRLDEAIIATYDVHEAARAHRLRLPAGWALTARAAALAASGNARTRAGYREALTFWRDTTESLQVLAIGFGAAAFLVGADGDSTWVPIVAGAFERVAGQAPNSVDALLAGCQTALGEPVYRQRFEHGRSLTPRELADELIERLSASA